jgi:hypothetical protein
MHNKQEMIAVIKELQEIYEKLKHFPGQHNQDDHAWNAGLEGDDVKKVKKTSPQNPLLSMKRRNKYQANRKNSLMNGIASPFEATKIAANQARVLGVINPLTLLQAILKASNLLRDWVDQFKTAISSKDNKDAKKISAQFKKVSAEIAKISEQLQKDAVAQNIFKSIMQSYQNNLEKIFPQLKEILKDFPLYDKNTPDAKMAKKVEEKINQSTKESE